MAAAREAKQKAVVSAIGNGIKKGGEIIGNIGDGISIGSTLLAVPTAGGTTPGIIAGEKNPNLLMNSENLIIWRANLVTKAAEAGVENKLEEKP
ncbi:MAG: hypothetical protein IPJ13_22945 [Saprospiraceae bacterium]|nr:hypothetical protein [Saprospiraceae bacterium]